METHKGSRAQHTERQGSQPCVGMSQLPVTGSLSPENWQQPAHLLVTTEPVNTPPAAFTTCKQQEEANLPKLDIAHSMPNACSACLAHA